MGTNFRATYCNLHPKQEVNLLRFHKNINQVFSCLTCVEQQEEIQGVCTINIPKFLEADPTSFFQNWPPFDNENSQYLKSTIRYSFEKLKSGNMLTEEMISKYFSEFRYEVICKINFIEKKYQTLLKSCLEHNIVKEYNMISKRNEIRDIILDQQITIEKKNQKMKQIVDDVLQNTSKNTKNFMEIVEKFEFDKELNLKQLQEVKTKIHQCLEFHYSYLTNKLARNFNLEIDDKNKEQIQVLSSLFRNPFNQCEDAFLDSLEKTITNNFHLFKDLFSQRIFKLDQLKVKQESLTQDQIQRILVLTREMIKISANSSIDEPRFYKSKAFCESYLKETVHRKKIEQTFLKYPIFEIDHLIEDIQGEISNMKRYFIKVKLVQSAYKQSKKQSEIRNDNTLQVTTVQNSQHSQMQAYCDFILDPEKKYIFRVEVAQNKNRERLCFGFGLGQDSKIDDNLYEQKLMYHSKMNSWGVGKIVKGKNLSDKLISCNLNDYEVQICIKDNHFQVTDIPNKANINSLETNNNSLKENKDFRFFISFSSCSMYGDWIKVSSIQVVDNFT